MINNIKLNIAPLCIKIEDVLIFQSLDYYNNICNALGWNSIVNKVETEIAKKIFRYEKKIRSPVIMNNVFIGRIDIFLSF